MADGDVAARPGRGRSFWILVVLLVALLIAAIVAGLMWSAENQRSAQLERQNSQLMQERAASETNQPEPSPQDNAINRRVVTSEAATQLRLASAQHVCQADNCPQVEFDIEQVYMATNDDEASFAQVEVDREDGDDTDLFLKRDNMTAQWRAIYEGDDDDPMPAVARDAGFPAEFFFDD